MFNLHEPKLINVKGKALVTGCGEGCGTSGSCIFCLDNWYTDGGEIFRRTCQPPFTPRRIPGTFSRRLSQLQGRSAAGRIRSIEKSNDIGNQTHVLQLLE
jgi:hypothetical protein